MIRMLSEYSGYLIVAANFQDGYHGLRRNAIICFENDSR